MSALDRLIPEPRLRELTHVDVASTPDRAWRAVRHGNLARSPIIRGLFAIRELPGRLQGQPASDHALRIDQLVSSEDEPGFQVLVDDPPHEVAVGAIGKVWRPTIPFVHTSDADAYAGFVEPNFVKVAWAIRVMPRGELGSRIEVEVRVAATDECAWRRFRRYFALVGPGSRFIRRSALAALADDLGVLDETENRRPLEGDELLPDAREQQTHWVDVAAPSQAIWPWLMQMGGTRAGFYSIDLFDNGGAPSAKELHPEIPPLAVGDIVPATPRGGDGFEVLRVEPNRCLVLGGLHGPDASGTVRQLPFSAERPTPFWHVTWAFVLEPLDPGTTRLHARVRVAYSAGRRLHLAWIRPVHALMERVQLRNLAARAEGRTARDDWRDVAQGMVGAAHMAAAFLTPFRREARNHWGLSEELAMRRYPGDELVPEPQWSWTHGIEIEAPAAVVWPWVAQLGADRAGFYSYQWLENIAGCNLRNAERIHPEWQLSQGDRLVLHPSGPSLRVVEIVPGQALVTHDAKQPTADDQRWVNVSWLLFVEPLGPDRCRLISRYRCATSNDLKTRVTLGPALVEPIGFAMDRRMLLGIKQRAEPPSHRAQ